VAGVIAAERLERLNAVRCVHGAGFGDCPEWFCERARRSVIALAAEAVVPGPELLPISVVRSSAPHCRWCHQRIRGAFSAGGWAHEATNREACGPGSFTAAPVTYNDQRRILRGA
jgi:hypothetical protein